ncbi:unnamed protein product [Adineta ricciae]|uniref:Uncharacterized protein n=1 Tax=Adineta ricciae TaxID=249248 RepID=A0A815YGK3_ADIRI|nr:unnamed protein product [Adineta ricciae]
MVVQYVSKRPHSRSRRSRIVRFLTLFFLGLVSSTVTFLITFFATSDYIFDRISSFLTPESNSDFSSEPSLESIKDYRPRDFLGKKKSINYDYYITYKDFNFRKPDTLTYENRTYANSTPIFYRFPRRTSILALLLIFHSCRHSAVHWFHTPERQRILGAAIDLGFACLVFQASDKTTKCWSNEGDIYQNRDVYYILKGLEGFFKDYPELISLPRYTFGSSSGGIFSSVFAINQQYPIHGQVIYTSIILPVILHKHIKNGNYPTTVWIHMLRDIEFASAQRIDMSKEILRKQNISCTSFPIEPSQLTSTIFHDRQPVITHAASQFLYSQLRQYRWLNNYNYMLHNPRQKLTWQGFLFAMVINQTMSKEVFDNIHTHKPEIYELLNTFYGEHEISHERSYEALKWLLDNSNK